MTNNRALLKSTRFSELNLDLASQSKRQERIHRTEPILKPAPDGFLDWEANSRFASERAPPGCGADSRRARLAFTGRRDKSFCNQAAFRQPID